MVPRVLVWPQCVSLDAEKQRVPLRVLSISSRLHEAAGTNGRALGGDKAQSSEIRFSSGRLTNRTFLFIDLFIFQGYISHFFFRVGHHFHTEVIMIFQISADFYSRCLNLLMSEEGRGSNATRKWFLAATVHQNHCLFSSVALSIWPLLKNLMSLYKMCSSKNSFCRENSVCRQQKYQCVLVLIITFNGTAFHPSI